MGSDAKAGSDFLRGLFHVSWSRAVKDLAVVAVGARRTGGPRRHRRAIEYHLFARINPGLVVVRSGM
jgi:hypothetical protein